MTDLGAAEADADRLANRLYVMALRITGAEHYAEAAIDAALRITASGAPAHGADPALESSLYMRVAQAAHQRLRQHPRHGADIGIDDVMPVLSAERHFEPMADWSDRIREPALRSAGQAVLRAAIDALPPDYRTALILHDVEGAAQADIAEIVGVDVPTVRSHVHRARLFVRQRLSGYFERADAA